MGSPRIASIHILDDDSLLHVFHLYQPFLLGDQDDLFRLFGEEWRRAWTQWWYKISHVCQKWRKVILGSTILLG
jgi:hypothetical protein